MASTRKKRSVPLVEPANDDRELGLVQDGSDGGTGGNNTPDSTSRDGSDGDAGRTDGQSEPGPATNGRELPEKEGEPADGKTGLIAHVSAIYVPHTRFVDTLSTIRSSIDMLYGVCPEPACLYVTGPSGVGKTTLLRKLAEDYPRVTDGVQVSHPLLGKFTTDSIPLPIVKIGSEPTVISIGQQMLKALGDPNWWRSASKPAIEARVDMLIERCESKCVVFDEAQRIVDRSGTVVSFNIIDWIRDRAAANGLIIILVGLGRLAAAFPQDTQFSRRYDAEIRLLPYLWKDEEGVDLVEDQADFRAVMIAVKEVLPLPLAPEVDVDHPDEFSALVALKRFYYASNGLLGRLLQLFVGVMRLISADGDEHTHVTLALLSTAFKKVVDFEKLRMSDPFAADWEPALPPSLVDDRQLVVMSRRKRRASAKTTQVERQRDMIAKFSKKR